jgi:hypothetical protein
VKIQEDGGGFAASFTADCWSSIKGKGYHGGTSHYISKYWELVSLVLGCRRIKGTKDADALVESIHQWAVEYGLEFTEETPFFGGTTDDGGADSKSGRLQHCPCLLFCCTTVQSFSGDMAADESGKCASHVVNLLANAIVKDEVQHVWVPISRGQSTTDAQCIPSH